MNNSNLEESRKIKANDPTINTNQAYAVRLKNNKIWHFDFSLGK
jgi:hypothetical protein